MTLVKLKNIAKRDPKSTCNEYNLLNLVIQRFKLLSNNTKFAIIRKQYLWVNPTRTGNLVLTIDPFQPILTPL